MRTLMMSAALLPLVTMGAGATAADIPGGPGTGVTLALGRSQSSDLGSATDEDWFRTSLEANKLYAFVVGSVESGVDFRLTVRDAAGKSLATASLPAGDPYGERNQLNFRPETSGTYYLEVSAGADPARLSHLYTVTLLRDLSSSFADAAPLAPNQAFTGRIESEYDIDYFEVRLEKGKTYDLFASVLDRGKANLYDRNQRLVGFVDVDIGKLSYFQPAYTGRYFIEITDCCTGRYTLRLVTPADRGRAMPSNDVIIGTNGPDKVDALAGGDLVRGLAGNDVLGGGPGLDVLLGGPGNDRINGGLDSDQPSGEAGDDIITGGPGNDFMAGGPGNDRFRFFGDPVRGYDAGVEEFGSDGRDYISDFARGDKLDLRGVDADATRAGRQSFRFVGTAAFTGPAQVRYRVIDRPFLGKQTLIEMNVDADAEPESIVQIQKAFVPQAGDFILRDTPRAP